MFDSSGSLAAQITTLLGVLRALGGDGRYACLTDAHRVHFESGDGDTTPLRNFIENHAALLFRLPDHIDGERAGPTEDVFADWPEPEDGFFLAFINRRVAAVVVCPTPEELQHNAWKPLKALAERVFQWNPRYRSGGGPLSLFFSRPRLDVVVVSPPAVA